jgi:hypothetical protein
MNQLIKTDIYIMLINYDSNANCILQKQQQDSLAVSFGAGPIQGSQS